MYKNVQKFLRNAPPSGDLFTAVHRFLGERLPEVSQASLIHLYRTLEPHAQSLKVSLADVTPALVAAYVAGLQVDYSPGTVRPIVGDLKQFYKWAYEEGLTTTDCGRRLKKPQPVKEKHHAEEGDMVGLIKYLSASLSPLLYRDLFGILCGNDDGWLYEDYKTLHDLTAVSFLYETGCRAGELCNLSAHHMSKAVQKKAESHTVTCYGKTNNRNYHFTETTAELYRLWAGKRPFTSAWAFYSWRRGGEPGKLTTNALSQMLARRCKQAGIPVFRAHSMRHAKVIRSRKLVGLEIASRLIDHSSISTTREYDYIDDDELSVAAALTGLKIELF